MKLLLHLDTKSAIERFLGSPSHALLIEGPSGSGKGAVANYLALQILGSKDMADAYLRKEMPVDGSITIDTIRSLQQFLRLKTIGKAPLRRVLLIEDAHLMTIEAQNALLKSLEEPPADTVVILTAIADSGLLPTIYSRAQHITLKMPSLQDVQAYFAAQGNSEAEISRAYAISDGHSGLLAALLQGNVAHPLVVAIDEAKGILSSTTFERLGLVDRFAKQRNELPQLLYALQRVSHAVMKQASEKQQERQLRKAHTSLKRLIEAEANLPRNPNLKLLLTDLFLNL